MNKQIVKAKIKKWLLENNVEAGIYIAHFRYNYQHPFYIGIHNGKNAVPINKHVNKWLNKIMLCCIRHDGRFIVNISETKVRTDKDFLDPLPENFRQFVESMLNGDSNDT